MKNKWIGTAAVACLAALALVLVPGGVAHLFAGAATEPSPSAAGESSLTLADTAIPARDVRATWSYPKARYVTLAGDHFEFPHPGAKLSEDRRTLTITDKGTYVFRGDMTGGQIVVDVPDGRVHLVLAGMSLTAGEDAAAITVRPGASIVRLIAETGTQNTLSDGATRPSADIAEPAAAICSEEDLVFCGTGELTVHGNYRDGIYSRDRVILSDLSLSLFSQEDGIVGHDALLAQNAVVRAICGRDALKSNSLREGRGYVYLASGSYYLQSGTDGISASWCALLTGGDYTIRCGGGSSGERGYESRKGIKARAELVISGGAYDVDAADDALHSDGKLALTGGSFTLRSGEEAVQAKDLLVADGDVTVHTCQNGLAAENLTVSGGTTRLTAKKNGVRAQVRMESTDSGFSLYPKDTETPSAPPAGFLLSGGILIANAAGDALRVDGDAAMTGGVAFFAGPEISGGDPSKVTGAFSVSGGTVIFSGRSSFSFPCTGNLPAVEITFARRREAGALIGLRSAKDAVFTVQPPYAYRKLILCSDRMQAGTTYSLLSGGTLTEDAPIFSFGVAAHGAACIGSFAAGQGCVRLAEGSSGNPPTMYPEEEIV